MKPLELADDALIAAQRLSEWVSRAPTLEEDVALANIALDQLGAARLWLQGLGDEDQLAYLRSDFEFRNCLLVELPLGGYRGELDFGWTVAWLLFLSAAQSLRYKDLAGSDAVAAKAVKESAYHLDHATQWTIRLGDGTEESRRRIQAAIDEYWPYTHELTEGVRERWLSIVEPVLARATLTQPGEDGWKPSGGREGRHTEHLSYLLAEMQSLHRAHPGAPW
ncbi:MAG TPA: 1,2-phenylacetyl-CoA epoxidase subunit PaaC [Candidatus Limnocylindrales bacterium]